MEQGSSKLSGKWLRAEDFHTQQSVELSDEELYETEADRTDAQARFILKLMQEKGFSKIEQIQRRFKPKKNGKISIGMAGEIIDYLLNYDKRTNT